MIRVLIAAIGIASLVLFKIAGIRWQQVSFVVKFIGFFAFFKCGHGVFVCAELWRNNLWN